MFTIFLLICTYVKNRFLKKNDGLTIQDLYIIIFKKNMISLIKMIIASIIINFFVFSESTAQNKSLIASDFTIISTQNDTFNLYTELGKGKAILLDFFSINCVPCQVNTYYLDEIYRNYGSGDSLLLIWGIESENGTNAEVDTFKSMFGASFPGFSTQYLNNDTILSLYNITYTPIYYFICTDTTTKPIMLSQLSEVIESCIGPPNNNNTLENTFIEFNIYPNPASTFVQVESGKLIAESCSLLDIYGRTIQEYKIHNSNLIIQIEDLPKGIYFIRMRTNKGFVVKKFIKS